MDVEQVRTLALALEGTAERDHHGFPCFRARTIFATLPDVQTLRIMLPETAIREAVAEFPDWASAVMWGKRVSAVGVELSAADPTVVAEWLRDAHVQHC